MGRPMRSAHSSPSPKKLDAVRQEADQVKRIVWVCATPLLRPVMVPLEVREDPELPPPPPLRLPGSLRLNDPEGVPPVVVPVTLVMSAVASPPPSSTRVNAPLMLVVMKTVYPTGAVRLNVIV